jgi:hypothetical protein
LNMSGEQQHVRFDLTPLKLGAQAQTLLSTMHGVPKEMALADVVLEPFAVYMGRINGSGSSVRPAGMAGSD